MTNTTRTRPSVALGTPRPHLAEIAGGRPRATARIPVPDSMLDAAAVSVAGGRRDNQDSGCAGSRLIAVADGVGGHAGGAIASALAIRWLTRQPYQSPGGGAAALARAVAVAVAGAGSSIRLAGRHAPELAGMATTLTAVVLDGGVAVVGHLGDSRAYLARSGRLSRLTDDQTWVQTLVDAGIITAEQARTHPMRSVLTHCLHGAFEDLTHLRLLPVAVRRGDRLLVSSDGLHDVLAPGLIGRILADETTPAAAASALVSAALASGTPDNATAVVADVVGVTGDGAARARPAVLVGAAA